MSFYNQGKGGRRFIFFPLSFIALVLLLAGVVMLLWNAILPELIKVNRISYPQSLGLLVLCRILFGNYRRPFGSTREGMHGGGPWRAKWMNMTPEERARMREAWKEKCRQEKK